MRLVYAEIASWKEIVFWREKFHYQFKINSVWSASHCTSTIHFVRAKMQKCLFSELTRVSVHVLAKKIFHQRKKNEENLMFPFHLRVI